MNLNLAKKAGLSSLGKHMLVGAGVGAAGGAATAIGDKDKSMVGRAAVGAGLGALGGAAVHKFKMRGKGGDGPKLLGGGGGGAPAPKPSSSPPSKPTGGPGPRTMPPIGATKLDKATARAFHEMSSDANSRAAGLPPLYSRVRSGAKRSGPMPRLELPKFAAGYAKEAGLADFASKMVSKVKGVFSGGGHVGPSPMGASHSVGAMSVKLKPKPSMAHAATPAAKPAMSSADFEAHRQKNIIRRAARDTPAAV